MDFGVLPPEINSGRMYAGPGSGPMLAAAAAWDGLATELQSTAADYGSVISVLTGVWSGQSSGTMAAAAAPYVAWMSATAALAREAAAQASAAAAAYEAAFAATVPPPVVAANRAELAVLAATNIFGQNTGAIAAAEARYAEMWAQDAAAMYGYAGSSSVATQVTPFAAPPPTTNAAGLATQGVAVAQAVGASAGNARSLVSEVLEFLATAGTNYNKTVASLMNAVTGVPYASSVYNSMLGLGFAESKMVLPANDTVISTIFGMVQFQKFFNPVTPFNPDLIPKSALGAGLGLRSAISSGLGSTAPAISAGASQAGSVGGMSVPPSWAAATPAIRTVAAVFSSTGLQAVPAAAISEGSLLSQMALASVAGGALGGAAARATGGFLGGGRVTAVKKSLKDSDSPDKLRRVVAHMVEKPESVQHWHTDEDGLDDLLAELKKKPGIHAVHMAGGNKAEIAPTISESG